MVVGTIWQDAGKCVEAAAVISDGKILEVVTGSDVVFTNGKAGFGVSVNRAPFAPAEPVSPLAQVMLYPYAATDTFHTVSERRTDYAALSRTLNCHCIACGSGATGSTASGVGAGQVIFAFDGKVTVENEPFLRKSQIVYCDIDTDEVNYLANRNMTEYDGEFEVVEIDFDAASDLKYYPLSQYPFIPQDDAECKKYTSSIIEISAAALANRMQCSRSGKMVLGVSGGLDSTMALLTCVKCCELLDIPTSSIVAVSMP
jgi:NAD+ synthase (glutamine-hydrolysing)